jgi:hypothetical protein
MLELVVWAGSLTFLGVKLVWPVTQIYRLDRECDRLDAIIRQQEADIRRARVSIRIWGDEDL